MRKKKSIALPRYISKRRARAKRKGVKFGRKQKLTPDMIRVAADRYAKGETMAELALEYEVSEPTIWRALTARPFEASASQ